jgi:ABC-type glutathione transport system ATPase component
LARLSTVRNADRIIVLEAGEIVEEGPPEALLANVDGRFYRMHQDQKLDEITIPAALADLDDVDLPPNFAELANLVVQLRFSTQKLLDLMYLQDPDEQRRLWARSSLKAHAKLGKSYSVQSTDRERLALPVMSKKRRRLDEHFKTNIMEVVDAEKEFSEEQGVDQVEFLIFVQF